VLFACQEWWFRVSKGEVRMPNLTRYDSDDVESIFVRFTYAIVNFKGARLATDLVRTIDDVSTGAITFFRNEARDFSRNQLARQEVQRRFDNLALHFKEHRFPEARNCYNFCTKISGEVSDPGRRLEMMRTVVDNYDDDMNRTVQAIHQSYRKRLSDDLDQILLGLR
jgi:hypothetical protein